MEIKVTSDRYNPLLNRREISFELPVKAQVTRAQMRKIVAASLGVDANLVIVRKMVYVFGGGKIVGEARVYDDPETLTRLEPEYMRKRNSGGEEDGGEVEDVRDQGGESDTKE